MKQRTKYVMLLVALGLVLVLTALTTRPTPPDQPSSLKQAFPEERPFPPALCRAARS